MLLKSTYWSLAGSLALIRKWQEVAHSHNLHLALAGSVLNQSESNNDLDVICMDQHNGKKSDWESFSFYLAKQGNLIRKTGPEYEADNRYIYELQLENGKQIDIFRYDIKEK